MSKTVTITNGPSREELFDGLRLSFEDRLVHFEIDNDKISGGGFRWMVNNGKQTHPIEVLMHAIESKDDRGDNWSVLFSITEIMALPGQINHSNTRDTVCTVKAEYSTKTRKGIISL